MSLSANKLHESEEKKVEEMLEFFYRNMGKIEPQLERTIRKYTDKCYLIFKPQCGEDEGLLCANESFANGVQETILREVAQQVTEEKATKVLQKLMKKEKYPSGVKKEMLGQLLGKLDELRNQPHQQKKFLALQEIYNSFKDLDLSNVYAITQHKALVRDKLKEIETFSNRRGEIGASIKHSIFSVLKPDYYHTVAASNTRLLIGKLEQFIESNSFPGEYELQRGRQSL